MESRELPLQPNPDHYKKQAKAILKAVRSQDPNAVEQFRRWHPRGAARAEPKLADAQLILARQHGFESWPRFAKHVEELGRANSPFAEFERAVDAVVRGDAATLRQLLRATPELVDARSPRRHRATLLHYVSANGVEDYRQKTPANAVEIAGMLLDAGAEVDAVADAYGKGTALGLTATSSHPLRAGVLIPLLDLLIARGASVDGAPGGWSIVNACLANGRKLGAEYLANRGARLDLEGAAGVGRLDVTRSFFDDDGSLRNGATRTQMESGFIWACEYGRAETADFLLNIGVDSNTCRQHRLTGLHWAAGGGEVETLKVVLRHKLPLEAQNVWGGTPLASAIWAATESDPADPLWPKGDWYTSIELLLGAGANVNSVRYPTGDPRIDALLHRYGAGR